MATHECKQETVIDMLRETNMTIYNEIKDASCKLDNVGLCLERNTLSLEEHMKQTNMLKDQQQEFHKDLLELQTFKIKLQTIGSAIVKAVAFICAAVSFIYGILGFYK